MIECKFVADTQRKLRLHFVSNVKDTLKILTSLIFSFKSRIYNLGTITEQIFPEYYLPQTFPNLFRVSEFCVALATG
jgi:hypothetical protein